MSLHVESAGLEEVIDLFHQLQGEVTDTTNRPAAQSVAHVKIIILQQMKILRRCTNSSSV